MRASGDIIVMAAIVALLAWWVWIRFKKWLYAPPKFNIPVRSGEKIESPEADLLKVSGYKVLSGKHRVPLRIEVDDKKSLGSMYYIDYFAVSDNNELYIVKVAKQRQSVDWTGSGLRDRFFIYQLLFREASGVIYVDADHNQIRKIRFEIDDTQEEV